MRRKPNKSERQRLEQALDEAAEEQVEAITGAVALLESLDEQRIPYAWQDELPGIGLPAAPLGRADALIPRRRSPWPALDGCWQASPGMGIERLDGWCCWSAPNRVNSSRTQCRAMTIGLAASGPSCGLSPARSTPGHTERDRLRADATLELHGLGVHSASPPGRAATLPARPRRPPPERRKLQSRACHRFPRRTGRTLRQPQCRALWRESAANEHALSGR